MTNAKKVLKQSLIQARLDVKEHQEVISKSLIYTKGNVSDFVRLACLSYRPLKRSEGKKLK